MYNDRMKSVGLTGLIITLTECLFIPVIGKSKENWEELQPKTDIFWPVCSDYNRLFKACANWLLIPVILLSLLILLVLFCFFEGAQYDFTFGVATKKNLSSDLTARISCDDKAPRVTLYFSVLSPHMYEPCQTRNVLWLASCSTSFSATYEHHACNHTGGEVMISPLRGALGLSYMMVTATESPFTRN